MLRGFIPVDCPTCHQPRGVTEFLQPEVIYDVYVCTNQDCSDVYIPSDPVAARDYPPLVQCAWCETEVHSPNPLSVRGETTTCAVTTRKERRSYANLILRGLRNPRQSPYTSLLVVHRRAVRRRTLPA
jgi:hypothetical protein